MPKKIIPENFSHLPAGKKENDDMVCHKQQTSYRDNVCVSWQVDMYAREVMIPLAGKVRDSKL
jgi:hypothetical protein